MIHYATRPPAGQQLRPQDDPFDAATNRQQRKLVKTFDQWAAELKADLAARTKAGALTPELIAALDAAIPNLTDQLSEVTAQGVKSAARVSAQDNVDRPEVQLLIDQKIAEANVLVKDNLIPAIHESLVDNIARGFNPKALQVGLNALRSGPAQYAGGYWVMLFEVQRLLGKLHEDDLKNQGGLPEPVRWVLDPTAKHCIGIEPGKYGCSELEGVYEGGWNELPTVPASEVQCYGNCRCHIEVLQNGTWRRGVIY